MKLQENTDYYVMTDDYPMLPAMTRVRLHGEDDQDDVYVVWEDELEWLWSGYVKPHHLLTAEQIVKLYEDHLMLVDACERHG